MQDPVAHKVPGSLSLDPVDFPRTRGSIMATPQQIVELRFEVKEPDNIEPYTDQFLSDMLDTYGASGSAQRVWIAKRNAVANLVDITEGGSSRKMSQLFDNYEKIVNSYQATPEAAASTARRSMTRAATRG